MTNRNSQRGWGGTRCRALVIGLILVGPWLLPSSPVLAAGDRDAQTAQTGLVIREWPASNQEVGTARSLTGRGFSISHNGVPAPESHGLARQTADEQRAVDQAAALAGIRISVDSLLSEPVLNVVVSPLSTRRTHDPLVFTAYSNYTAFLRSAEVRVFPDATTSPRGKPLARVPVKLNEPTTWHPELPPGSYQYLLRVTDSRGHFDETRLLPFAIGGRGVVRTDPAPGAALLENLSARRNIALQGGTVTVHIPSVPADRTVHVYGQPVAITAAGQAYAQILLPFGHHQLVVDLLDRRGTGERFLRSVHIDRTDRFAIAMADFTLGYQSADGPFAQVTGPDSHFEDDTYLNGRLAFYYKGQLRHDITATLAADTEEERIEDLFDNFGRRDARSFLRRLDPALQYPVYGDDSTTVEDAPTGGNFYVRLERGESEFIWGDFQTTLTGTDLIQYSRSLYGANLRLRSQAGTSFGETRSTLDLFLADPGTVASRDEFRGTGGTLFYLRRQDVTEGSERVFVEVRDRDSELVISRRELISAVDYDVNYIQGRISLRSPLASTAEGVRFVRDADLAGNPAYLVVNYEFTPSITEPDTFAAGGRAQHWFGDRVALGLTGFDQGDDGFEQTLVGGDVTVRLADLSYVRAEIARSNGPGNGSAVSASGGLGFSEIGTLDRTADGYRLEGLFDLRELGANVDGQLSTYWQDREAGFSSPGQLTGADDLSQFGAQLKVALNQRTNILLKTDGLDSRGRDNLAVEAGAEHRSETGLHVAAGVRYDDRSGNGTGLLLPGTANVDSGDRTDVNITLGYDTRFDVDRHPIVSAQTAATDAEPASARDWALFGFVQATVAKSGSRRSNDRIGVGGRYRFSERFAATAEVSEGDLGAGARVGGEFNYSDRGALYLAHTLEAENPDALNSGRLGRSTLGMRNRFNDWVSVFAEARHDTGAGATGTVQHFGVDFTPFEKWLYAVSYETGTLQDPAGGEIDRDAASATIGYSHDQNRVSATLEVRSDDNPQTGDLDIRAGRALAAYQLNPATRLHAKLHASRTESSIDSTLDAKFTEAVLAAAYRPLANDDLNLLFKYTYLADLPSPAQVSALGVPIDFAQRSHVFAVDGTAQLTERFALGAKYAYRRGELRASRDDTADWFSSSSDFLAVRAEWYFVEQWDVLIEARRLRVREADDERTGVLAAVHRHFGNHLKIGVGYNFTDFSDDLTDLSFDAHGIFINVLGMY